LILGPNIKNMNFAGLKVKNMNFVGIKSKTT
jgi:hypothetical protein